ncbi:MAG: InlB B-repeat-containing protein [Bacilli bacterium]|nr:InlB B-repeat-containing protein [Bacilli bacterium]
MKHGKVLFIFTLVLPTLFSCGNKPTQDLCTVTFNPNSGTITSGSSSIQVKSGTSFSQCDTPIVTKVNELFKYWAFDIEGSNKVEASYKITSDIEVYAHFANECHTVTFNENGGSIVGEKTRSVEDGALFSKCDKPTATKENYEFKYWTFDAAGEETINTDYIVEDDFTVYAQYRETRKIYLDAPENSSIVSYGSTVVSYGDEQTDNITATSSNKNILTVELDKSRSCIYLDAANGNVEGTATVTVSDGRGSDSVNVSVHHPTTTQEAAESFDFAIGRGAYDITLTFNYDNQDSLDDFLNNRIETRLSAPSVYERYTWNTGIGKTNHVELKPSEEMATKSKDISQSSYSQYYYKNLKNAAYELRHSKIQPRSGDHFAIDDAKKRLKVHNSETLFFALERGFRPIFDGAEIAIVGSVANRAYQVYQEARGACANAFGTETTDDLMKVRQLFEWLMDNTHYDHWITQNPAPEEAEDFYNWSSYFAEGVFLNKGIAVCDGFSKALAIMGGIEGLPIIRSAGFATYLDEEGKSVVSGHAWNYYHHSDGKWYLICPTWAHKDNDADEEFVNYNYSAISYQPFMTQSNYFYSYTYKAIYNACIDQGYSPTQAEEVAKEAAKPSDFKEALFTDVTKSNSPLVSNIYTTDIFDKSKKYDFDLNSDIEAKALGNAIPIMNEDFCINLSFGSWNYVQSLANVIKEKMKSCSSIIVSADYSYTDCTVCVKF